MYDDDDPVRYSKIATLHTGVRSTDDGHGWISKHTNPKKPPSNRMRALKQGRKDLMDVFIHINSYLRRRASRSDSRSTRISSSLVGPFTFLIIERLFSP